MEARALMRCLRSGVSVPGIRMVDPWDGIIGIEMINGPSLRTVLGGEDEELSSSEGGGLDDRSYVQRYGMTHGALRCLGGRARCLTQSSEEQIMQLIGRELAKMHAVDVVHGDLTTSNMMLRPSQAPQETPLEVVRSRPALPSLSSRPDVLTGANRLRAGLPIRFSRRQGRRPLRLRTSIHIDTPGFRRIVRGGSQRVR